MREIILLEPVNEWFLELCVSDPSTSDEVERALDVFAVVGPTLNRPLADTIHHSNLHNLKELRPGSSRHTEIRILFVFDPERQAVILVAGDKAGQWSRWYDKAIPLAESRYADYLAEREKEK